ncbi:MAG TPA: hypothetical protein VG028_15285 [Terriglobia bacterium]|nr:hypothetical protein [Terriglobia bacterium]
MKTGIFKIGLGLFLALLMGAPLSAEQQQKGTAPGGEEFFIISSVNMSKDQLVLKHPTEVTELMLVNRNTTCLNEQGKPLACKDLRAGDTVYVTSSRSSGGGEGARVAVRIRIGPMTIEEVHRKYVDFQ